MNEYTSIFFKIFELILLVPDEMTKKTEFLIRCVTPTPPIETGSIGGKFVMPVSERRTEETCKNDLKNIWFNTEQHSAKGKAIPVQSFGDTEFSFKQPITFQYVLAFSISKKGSVSWRRKNMHCLFDCIIKQEVNVVTSSPVFLLIT